MEDKHSISCIEMLTTTELRFANTELRFANPTYVG